MRVVIDTNVLVSGFLSKKSFPAKVIDAWIFHSFTPVVCREIIQEYCTVFAREKFSRLGSVQERLDLLNNLLGLSWVEIVWIDNSLQVISEDKKDNIFLECADQGKASYIVSGDDHLIKLKKFQGIKIVTARDFCLEHNY
jgi:putative PIN family toxin of toxin-antitoxin system